MTEEEVACQFRNRLGALAKDLLKLAEDNGMAHSVAALGMAHECVRLAAYFHIGNGFDRGDFTALAWETYDHAKALMPSTTTMVQ